MSSSWLQHELTQNTNHIHDIGVSEGEIC
ncbi:unnamed protein product [Spirodela intermedia]|uniref:Uncharacterized protein n=1 Tax=Spirodela intermedia TaxID=51605 RepID=A0A7I8KSU4_SPIIN|nr:unnamed protein product [Spirodela intermedia]